MKPNEILQDVQAKVSEMLKQSPAKDIERNVKACSTRASTGSIW